MAHAGLFFHRRRDHALNHHPQRRHVIAAHPAGQLQHLGREQQPRVLNGQDVLNLRMPSLGMDTDNVPPRRPVLPAQRHADALADLQVSREGGGDAVVERAVNPPLQRDGGEGAVGRRRAWGELWEERRHCVWAMIHARRVPRESRAVDSRAVDRTNARTPHESFAEWDYGTYQPGTTRCRIRRGNGGRPVLA